MSVHHPAVDVGTPPRTLCNHWETTEVRFHRFAEGGDERFRSPKFVCLGHYWNLTLWPQESPRLCCLSCIMMCSI